MPLAYPKLLFMGGHKSLLSLIINSSYWILVSEPWVELSWEPRARLPWFSTWEYSYVASLLQEKTLRQHCYQKCSSLRGRSMASLYPWPGRRNELPRVMPTHHLPFRVWLGNFLWGWRSWQKCVWDGKGACKPAWLIIFCPKAINICFLDKVTRFIFEGTRLFSWPSIIDSWEHCPEGSYSETLNTTQNPLDSFTQSGNSPNPILRDIFHAMKCWQIC